MSNSHHVEEFSKPISEEDYEKILSDNELVIVDCFATWCGPCISFKPVFEELSNKYPKIKFLSIDTDQTDWINNRYDIDSIPRFLFFKNGKLIYEHRGASAKIVFEYFIKTKLLELDLIDEQKEGISEQEFDELTKKHTKLVIEFHPSKSEEAEQLKPFYIPIMEEYIDVKFLIVEVDNKKTRWAQKRFEIKNEFPHFVMFNKGKIVYSSHIHHPDALKYAIEEKLYGRTPFAHDSLMAEEKFETTINAYEHAIVFIMNEKSDTSFVMRNYMFRIAEQYPDLPLIVLRIGENPWLKEKFHFEEGDFTRYGESGKKTPYFIFYKNGKIVHESGPLQPELFEDIIQGKLLKLFVVDEYDHGIAEEKFNTLLNKNPLVILDIKAVWCMPCTEMKPIFRDLSRKYSEIKFISVDLDYSRWMGEKFDIDSIPSFLFFKNGELINKHIGFMDEEVFEEKIREKFKIGP